MQNKSNEATACFKPKTFRLDMENHKKPGIISIGADIGYSAPKIVYPGGAFSFPSYAKKVSPSQIFFEYGERDIYIRDDTGIWAVGECAHDLANASETLDVTSELYGRNWYNAPLYKILIKASLGMSLVPNSYYAPEPDDEIHIQTGLPAQYMTANDVDDVKDVFAGQYEFDMRIGKDDWKSYNFQIEKEHVKVLAQPMGSLMAVCMGRDGKPSKDAQYFFTHNGEVDDYGFNTIDVSLISHGRYSNDESSNITLEDRAAREIMRRTCEAIRDTYGKSMQVSDLQRRLDTGTVLITDRKALRRTEVPFEELLLGESRRVFDEAFDSLMKARNYWEGTDFIIQTGGTYEAWKQFISDKLKDMGIRNVPGNINIPELPIEFANAWGFYCASANS